MEVQAASISSTSSVGEEIHVIIRITTTLHTVYDFAQWTLRPAQGHMIAE